jgi:hypothetical protein
MFFEGYIGAPPTITVLSPDISLFIILSLASAGATNVPDTVSALKAMADRNAIRLDMDRLPMDFRPASVAGDVARTTAALHRVRSASPLPELRELLETVSGNVFHRR